MTTFTIKAKYTPVAGGKTEIRTVIVEADNARMAVRELADQEYVVGVLEVSEDFA